MKYFSKENLPFGAFFFRTGNRVNGPRWPFKQCNFSASELFTILWFQLLVIVCSGNYSVGENFRFLI